MLQAIKFPTLKTLLDIEVSGDPISAMFWGWVVAMLPPDTFGTEITGEDAQAGINTIIYNDYGDRIPASCFDDIDPASPLTASIKIMNIVKAYTRKHIPAWVQRYKLISVTYTPGEGGFSESRSGSATGSNSGDGTNKFYAFNTTTNPVDHDKRIVSGSTSNTTSETTTRTDLDGKRAEEITKIRDFWKWSFLEEMIHDIILDITLSIY